MKKTGGTNKWKTLQTLFKEKKITLENKAEHIFGTIIKK